MSIKAGYSTPLLHVASIEESIRFYGLLGFVCVDTDRATPLGWARMHCEGGAVMFLRAEGPVSAASHSSHGAILCMYTPELRGLREALSASAVEVSPIKHPEYMPSGEIALNDPDGNTIVIAHWGKLENEAWEKRIAEAT